MFGAPRPISLAPPLPPTLTDLLLLFSSATSYVSEESYYYYYLFFYRSQSDQNFNRHEILLWTSNCLAWYRNLSASNRIYFTRGGVP